jgi:hypothetical protein
MFEYYDQLTGIISECLKNGNAGNITTTISKKYPELKNAVLEYTKFLDSRIRQKVSFSERIYCILNNINEIKLNALGEVARFINSKSGYSMNYDEKTMADEKENILNIMITDVFQEEKYKDTKTVIAYFIYSYKRTKHLYEPTAVLGYDYVICPHTGVRLVMIKGKYIENILKMTVGEYDALYPSIQKIATRGVDNIKSGRKEIDEETGLSKAMLGTSRAKITLSKVDPSTGMSGYDKLGQKTRATHMNNLDENGRNGYQRQAHGRVTTVMDNGLTVEQNAHIKLKATLVANNKSGSGGASMVSIRVLRPILSFLDSNNIKYYFDKHEYGIMDTDTNKYYFFDLTIPIFGLCIEYQSSAWHSNPVWDDARWNKWCPPKGTPKTAMESLTYDYKKARAMFRHRGIVTYYVWEDSAENDVKDMLCLLKTMNTK